MAYEHPWYKLEERVKSVNDRKSWIKRISSKTAPFVYKNQYEHASEDDV